MFGADGWFSGSSGTKSADTSAASAGSGGGEGIPQGKSTGPFPEKTEASSKVRQETEVENVLHRFNGIKVTLSSINGMSVKELKEKIEFYSHGKTKPDAILFLEKEEMRKNLIDIIFDSVGQDEMQQLNSYIYESKGETVAPFDRKDLIRAILSTK
jgi:hypothetical protein